MSQKNGHAVASNGAAGAVQSHRGGGGPSIFIIGGGIGAISVGLELDARGLTNWTAYEKMDGVGGTWYTNRYPGCRCDVPAIVYSHSRFQNTNWTQTHPAREEIANYWADLAHEQGLMGRIKLSHEFVRSEWDARKQLHVITVRDLVAEREFVVEAQIIINAAGALNTPKRDELPGEETFEGQVFHAADWPEDLTSDALHGKTVVVVGNGCSGVQIVGTLGLDPEINVISLARTRQWFVPNNPFNRKQARHSAPYSARRTKLMNRLPVLQRIERFLTCCWMDTLWVWSMDKEGARARAKIEKMISAWMRDSLPEYMRANAIPTHSFGAKRLIFEDGYFAALNTDHVKAVDGRIASLRSNAVVLDDGREMSADVVVLATGYDAEHIGFEVAGAADKTSNYRSRADFKMYRGLAMPGIPNYFTLLGNNMGLNHMSITTVIELQATQLGTLIQGMRDHGIPALDVKHDATEKYDAWIEKRLRKTTWYQVKNYWRGNDGTGRIFTHYPGSVRRMYWENHTVRWADYHGGERVVRAQRRRRLAYVLALLVAAGAWAVLTRTVAGAQVRQSVLGVVATLLAQSGGALAGLLARSQGVVEGVLARIKGVAA